MKKFLLALSFCLALAFSASAQKKVSIMGDSYSTFLGHIPPYYAVYYPRPAEVNDVQEVEQMWWSLFVASGDYVLEKVDSWSGSTICNTSYDGSDGSHSAFTTRVNMLGHPDIIFILGGTNDSWSGAPVGEYKYKGITHEDLFFYRPALAQLLSSVKAYYPKAEIYFILNNELRDDINSSTEKICARLRVPLIKLQDIDKQEGHPSIAGMKQICEQVSNFITK